MASPLCRRALAPKANIASSGRDSKTVESVVNRWHSEHPLVGITPRLNLEHRHAPRVASHARVHLSAKPLELTRQGHSGFDGSVQSLHVVGFNLPERRSGLPPRCRSVPSKHGALGQGRRSDGGFQPRCRRRIELQLVACNTLETIYQLPRHPNDNGGSDRG